MKHGFTSSLIAPAKSYWISQWAAASRAHGWRERSVRASSSGFTLLELSIVLVIIGLIIGGITVGADMIRSAELNSVVSDFQKYQTSVNTFKLKYNQLPGDMKNATAYWGAAHATPATCGITVGTGTQTCDGDGDGELAGISSGDPQNYEVFRFWQQLANAEILSGNYTGVRGSGGMLHHVIAENTPESRIAGAAWAAGTYGNYSGNVNLLSHNYGNFFMIGAPATNDLPYLAAFTPAEASTIDTKVDDGNPVTGRVVPTLWDTCTDATVASDDAASYLLATTTAECAIIFTQAFR